MRATTRYLGQLTEVEVLLIPSGRRKSPDKVGVFKCRLDNGNFIARHGSRLAVVSPELQVEEESGI